MGDTKTRTPRGKNTARGRARALALVMADDLSYGEMVADLQERYQVSPRTAKNWIAAARTQHLTETTGIDLESVANTRLAEVAEWQRRRARFRALADALLVDDTEAAGGLRFDVQANRYDQFIAKATGIWDTTVIDDLRDDVRRATVVAALVQCAHQLSRSDVYTIKDVVDRVIDGYSDTDADEQSADGTDTDTDAAVRKLF